jgi:hypothetical protein
MFVSAAAARGVDIDASNDASQDMVTLHAWLLAELVDVDPECPHDNTRTSAPSAIDMASRLVRYAKMFTSYPDSQGELQERGLPIPSLGVPATILDPIVRCLVKQVAANADALPFESLSTALTALVDLGVRPRDAFAALTRAAEATFPVLDTASASDVGRIADFVASLLEALETAEQHAALVKLRPRLVEFVTGLMVATPHGRQFQLGVRPMRTSAALVRALRSIGLADVAEEASACALVSTSLEWTPKDNLMAVNVSLAEQEQWEGEDLVAY